MRSRSILARLAATVKDTGQPYRKIKTSFEQALFNLQVLPNACPHASADLVANYPKGSDKTSQKAGVLHRVALDILEKYLKAANISYSQHLKDIIPEWPVGLYQ